jgi:Ca-activated chloride channel homolog
MLVMDTSGSMRAKDVEPDRLTAARKSATSLVDKLPGPYRVGLVTFSDFAVQDAAPSTDHGPTKDALERMVADGGTAMCDAISRGLRAARVPVPRPDGKGTRTLPAALVLLSDGANTAGVEDPITVAERARKLRIPIYTVALGTAAGYITHTRRDGTTWRESVPPDTATLQEIARETRGRYFQAADARRLTEIYRTLGTRLATRREKQEVTAAFAGGGLALLMFGMVAALARGGRLP